MKKVILKSKNPEFILRHVTIKDAQAYLEIHKDKEARKNFMSVHKNLKEARKSIKKAIERKRKKISETFAIDINGKMIGFVNIHSLNEKPLNKIGEIGTIGAGLKKEFRGKGIATKAVKLFIPYVFKKYKLKRISGRCRGFNKASARMMEKCGFVFEGRHKKEVYKDGKYYDNLYYAIVR